MSISYPFVVVLIIFIVFVGFNLYIRIKTFGLYKELVQRRIQFHFSELFSSQKWIQVLDKYPSDISLLQKFRKHILSTGILFISVIVIVCILLFTLKQIH